MQAPHPPKDEAVRLETLKATQILDTLPEERFDRFARMAKKLFNVPIALVSIVDENRQWFKSKQGLDATETPRDISFCGHAILGHNILVIDDATKDLRFADNPLVLKDPNIRFYAGCPISALNGQNLGTLCLIDDKPRQFDNENLQTLKELAEMVENEIATVQLATLDELTKISNRRGFLSLAHHSIELAKRTNIEATLIFFDLDKFKDINDRFGHKAGDTALIHFAELLKSTFREMDIFARLGGDEFVVLLTNTNKSLSDIILERLKEKLVIHNKTANQGFDITFSCGVVEYNSLKHSCIEDLLEETDASMYQNKKRRTHTLQTRPNINGIEH